jgi:oxygen-independent coproporphyrinogen III oxidase
MAGIYLHIPFCKQACHYCDFHFSTNLAFKRDMFNALEHEIFLQRQYLDEPLRTIYFGGGTPSLADPEDINMLMSTIRSVFAVTDDAEITLEANPDDLERQKLEAFRSIGINRLSIGIQSFDDSVLRFLNRAHDSKAAEECVPLARATGFRNISIDLIYAIPGQGMSEWENNIRRAIDLNVEHISAYSLTIEEKTVFGNWTAKGRIVPAGEDVSAQQFEILLKFLEESGYQHYEISNFAKPGFLSRHNSNYWRQEKYLGIGPSAHSYNLESRQFNVSNNYQYVAAIKEGRIPASMEHLTNEDQINDYLLTTLRTSWGSDLQKLRKEYQYDLIERRGTYIDTLLNSQLAVIENDHLKLTRKGKFLADKISSDLFLTT